MIIVHFVRMRGSRSRIFWFKSGKVVYEGNVLRKDENVIYVRDFLPRYSNGT